MNDPEKTLLAKALGVRGPRKELAAAAVGCLIGIVLLLGAAQAYIDLQALLAERSPPRNFFTINKRVHGGALANLGKGPTGFTEEEIESILAKPGVAGVGAFERNRFPIEINIWPAGKVGLGAAAQADVFFESVPNEFIDVMPPQWRWDENASFVPLIIPKFYLDLWNFGFAPTRVEYPPLSSKAALGMPIEIFIGDKRKASFDGKFVAFSRRINSILVPRSFLDHANKHYAKPATSDYFFLWRNGSVDGPPRTKEQLLALLGANATTDPVVTDSNSTGTAEANVASAAPPLEYSPLTDPAGRQPLEKLLKNDENNGTLTSRLIVHVEQEPTEGLLNHFGREGYEINRELPKHDLLDSAARAVLALVAGIGILLSLLAAAAFSASYRLIVTRAADPARNLLHLGFSRTQVQAVFLHRFRKLFGGIFLAALSFAWFLKTIIRTQAREIDLHLTSGLSPYTLLLAALFAAAFLAYNHTVIRDAIRKLE